MHGGKREKAGRKRGSTNVGIVAARALLEGQAENLINKALEMALLGDGAALKLCLDRILPARKGTLITIDLPALKTTQDVIGMQSALLAAASRGEITPDEAVLLGTAGDNVRKAIETHDLAVRVTQLEQHQPQRS